MQTHPPDVRLLSPEIRGGSIHFLYFLSRSLLLTALFYPLSSMRVFLLHLLRIKTLLLSPEIRGGSIHFLYFLSRSLLLTALFYPLSSMRVFLLHLLRIKTFLRIILRPVLPVSGLQEPSLSFRPFIRLCNDL